MRRAAGTGTQSTWHMNRTIKIIKNITVLYPLTDLYLSSSTDEELHQQLKRGRLLRSIHFMKLIKLEQVIRIVFVFHVLSSSKLILITLWKDFQIDPCRGDTGL